MGIEPIRFLFQKNVNLSSIRHGAPGRLYTYIITLMSDALFLELQRLMATLVGIEPNMTRVKISYPEPLDDRAVTSII